MRYGALTMMAWSVGACAAIAQPTVTQVFGKVVDQANRPIAGARVTAWRKPATDVGRLVKDPGTFATNANGVFVARGLAPGTYRFCAQLPGSDQLSPCRWGEKAPETTLRAGRMVDGVVVRMQKGHVIAIRIDDPGGHMDAHLGKTRGAAIAVGASGPGEPFFHATLVNNAKNGKDYSITVPAGRPVKVQVHSTFFDVGDDKGVSAAKGIVAVNRQGNADAPGLPVVVKILGVKGK